MYSNPDRALSEIKAIRTSARRAEGKADLHDISRELAYRARMKKRFSQSTVTSADSGFIDGARRKFSFASDTTDEVLTCWRDEELRSSPFVSPDEAPPARLGLEESDADGEGEAEEGMDEARKIWRDMKVRKYGSGGGGSIGRVRFSTDVNRSSGAGDGETGSSGRSKSLVRLRDVRETDFGPWRV